MGREVVSGPEVSSAFPHPARGGGQKADRWRDRLFKYIPGEVVALYLSVSTILATDKDAPRFLSWGIFGVCLVATPLYLWVIQKVRGKLQLAISTGAFIVWVLAIGGPFAQLEGYRKVYGAILLPIFTSSIASAAPATAGASKNP